MKTKFFSMKPALTVCGCVLAFVFFIDKVQAAEGDVWLTPVSQNQGSLEFFDTEIHMDTGGKDLGTFNLFFDFDESLMGIDLTQGDLGVDKGADTTNYLLAVNADDNINGHHRLGAITASNYANGNDVHLATIHSRTALNFTSGSIALDLRVNELSDELGAALSTGTVTGATVVYSDTTAPTIVSVSSDKTNGSYTTAEVIDVDLTFSENVTSTGSVTVTLETGATDRTCAFTVSDSSSATCDYTVQAGDTSSDLNVNSIAGTINDQSANAMTNFTPATNLADNKALVIDTTAPTVAEVTPVTTPTTDSTPDYTFSSTEAGMITYGGDCDSITTAASSGSNVVTFNSLADGVHSNCTVQVTDTATNASNVLNVTSFVVDTNAPTFTVNEGTDAGPVQTDTINATVADASSITTTEYGYSADNTCDGSDTYGNSFTSAADFNITGDHTDYLCLLATDELSQSSHQLVGQLNTDNTAPAISIISPLTGTTVNGATPISFTNDDPNSPECSPDNTNWTACTSAVTTLGDLTGWGAIADAATFTLYLRDTDSASNPATDSVANLTKESTDTTAPTIVSVSSDKTNGSYTTAEVIDVDLTFSENVTSTGSVTVTLETGATDRTCAFTVSDSSSATCDYTVQAGDTSSDLNVNSIAGTINDQSANAMTNFTPATNLADNKALVIDTTAPSGYGVSIDQAEINETNETAMSFTFSAAEVGASYNYSINDTDGGTGAVTGSGTISTATDQISSIDVSSLTNGTLTLTVYLTDIVTNQGADVVDTVNKNTTIVDTTPPTVSAGAPSGILTFGTTEATLSVSTNESATCRYSTTPNTAYGSMADTFSTTNSTSHEEPLTGLANNTSYNYYIRCQDGSTNANNSDYIVSFSVDDEEEEEDGEDESAVEALADLITAPRLKASSETSVLSSKKRNYARKKDLEFKGEETGLAGGEIKIYVDGDREETEEIGSDGKWDTKVKIKKNGTFELKIKYFDEEGTEIKSKKYKIKVDAEDPQFTNIPSVLWKNKGETIWWEAQDNHQVRRFKTEFAGMIHKTKHSGETVVGSFTIPSDVGRGWHTLKIRADDRAGNKETKYVAVFVR